VPIDILTAFIENGVPLAIPASASGDAHLTIAKHGGGPQV